MYFLVFWKSLWYFYDDVTPGTGKTLTGVKLVYWYVHMNKEYARSGGSHRQILYCGPSNSSVDVAASKWKWCLLFSFVFTVTLKTVNENVNVNHKMFNVAKID